LKALREEISSVRESSARETAGLEVRHEAEIASLLASSMSEKAAVTGELEGLKANPRE